MVHYLRAHSIGRGHTLALFSPSSWLLNLMIHATSELGATLYPLDPRLPEQWHQGLLEKAGVDYLICCEGSPSVDIDINTLAVKALNSRDVIGKNETDMMGLAVMIATSGSSGEPKGVMLAWHSIYHSAEAVNQRLELAATDCWLNCLPLYHIGGLSIIFRTALAGASMVLQQGFDAERVWRDLQRYPVTHLSLVPVMLAKLLAVSGCAPPEQLRVVLIGGAALDENLAQRAVAAGWPLFVTYGMSESGSQVATQRIDSAAAINDPIPLLAGVECSVVDEVGEPTVGPGHIRLRGDLLMRGYANPAHRAGDGLDDSGWFTTGDMGCYTPASGVHILGRTDEMIISGGEKIHPHQVERLMQDCPGVDELCVIGVDDLQWGERVCAIYCGALGRQELEQWCRQRIDGPLRPRLFVHLQSLPRLANGKLDRQALKHHCQSLQAQ